MKNYFLISLLLILSHSIFAQKQAKTVTAVILTSAQCDDCKHRIEEKLNYTKGIKFAELDLESKKVTVKFSTSKISLTEVKAIIAKIGYDADEVKAKIEDVKKLPLCCQPGGMKQ